MSILSKIRYLDLCTDIDLYAIVLCVEAVMGPDRQKIRRRRRFGDPASHNEQLNRMSRLVGQQNFSFINKLLSYFFFK